jgi:hypothetical protein
VVNVYKKTMHVLLRANGYQILNLDPHIFQKIINLVKESFEIEKINACPFHD